MAPCGSGMATRGPKSSKFLGVKKRGGCISVDMRCDRRWEVSGFATEELAGLAHDFFRLLHGESQRKAGKLNFPDNREMLVQFSEQHGMEKFKVVPMKEEKNWAVDKKKEFLDLMEEVHNQIKCAETASAEESLEGAEASRIQQSAARVQGSDDDLSRIRTNSEEKVDWDIERAFPSSDGSYKWFCSRESESAIHSRIVELERLLSAETEFSDLLDMLLYGQKAQIESQQAQIESLQAQNKRLKQQLAGLPFGYERSRESLAVISSREAEPKIKADSFQRFVSSPLNHIHTSSGEVYELEAELSKGVQQNCLLGSLSENNARSKIENEAITSVYENGDFGAVGEQIVVTSGVDWSSSMSGTGIINTSGCGSWGCDIVGNQGAAGTPGLGCNGNMIGMAPFDTSGYGGGGFVIVENQGAAGTPGLGWNVDLSDTGTINMPVYESEGFGVVDNQNVGTAGFVANTSSEWNLLLSQFDNV